MSKGNTGRTTQNVKDVKDAELVLLTRELLI